MRQNWEAESDYLLINPEKEGFILYWYEFSSKPVGATELTKSLTVKSISISNKGKLGFFKKASYYIKGRKKMVTLVSYEGVGTSLESQFTIQRCRKVLFAERILRKW